MKKLFNVSPPSSFCFHLLYCFSSLYKNRLTDLVNEKIKRDKRMKQVVEESKIEMEDDEGNVMSAKTYNDLKAQGII